MNSNAMQQLLAEQQEDDRLRLWEYRQNVAAGYFVCAFLLLLVGVIVLYAIWHFGWLAGASGLAPLSN